MPFYLTNENIEATMERNPDDVFNPSDTKHEAVQSISIVRRLILETLQQCFENDLNKTVVCSSFLKEDALKDEGYLTYVFNFESNIDEYTMHYYVPCSLNAVLKNSEIFLENLSTLIIDALNEEELSYLQDVELINITLQNTQDCKIQGHLYASKISIDNCEYLLYLELDSQFNKIF